MSDNRTEAQIEADLARTREDITATLNQLVEQVDPRQAVKRSKEQAQAKAEGLKDQARQKAQEFQEQAQATVVEAKRGDQRARAIVVGVCVGALAVGALVIKRLIK